MKALQELVQLIYMTYKQIYLLRKQSNYIIIINIMDLSILEDFQPQTSDSWNNWQFKHEELSNIPISFFNRFDRMGRCYDLSQAPSKKQQADFIMIEGNTRKKNKQFIERDNANMDKKVSKNSSLKVLTKKAKKNLARWTNQTKTKFKEIVKNQWIQMKNINKNFLQNLNQIHPKIQIIHSRGRLHSFNPIVERTSWIKKNFKQNAQYKIKTISTAKDKFLQNKLQQLFESEEQEVTQRKHVICSIQFLLALLTVRGGQYPWTISVQKSGNFVILDHYQDSTDTENQLSYLDLFTENQNTSNNMPKQESKIRQNCITATKLTQIFKDLLASGDVIQQEKDQQQTEKKEKQQEDQAQQQAQQQEEQQLENLQKYVKISIGKMDIYTKVTVDGAKLKENQQIQQYMIRAFIETETDGGWEKESATLTGKIVTQAYLSNTVSLQKWICEAKLAGVQSIKTGFIGHTRREPFLINVQDTSISSLESFLSFKVSTCWPIVTRILQLIFDSDDGNYILSRSAYSNPLSIKLFKIPEKDMEEQENQDN